MKHLFCLLFFLATFSSFGQNAKFSVENAKHKFSDVKQDTLLTHYFEVTNNGEIPLVISDYKVACPCTKIYLPKQPILPGKTDSLKVTFDTTGKSYYQDRTIYLTTNTRRGEEKLRIKVFVEPERE